MRASSIAIWIIHVLNFASSQKPPIALKAFKMLFWKVGTALERDLGCNRRHRHDSGRDPFVRIMHPQEALEALGPVSQRARLGHGARGLQPIWERLGAFASRPCPFSRLSLERRRSGGNLRSTADDLFCRGPVERARCHPEGTYLRSNRQRGQSRRGREGVLLLPRQHTHALLHEISI